MLQQIFENECHTLISVNISCGITKPKFNFFTVSTNNKLKSEIQLTQPNQQPHLEIKQYSCYIQKYMVNLLCTLLYFEYHNFIKKLMI